MSEDKLQFLAIAIVGIYFPTRAILFWGFGI